MRRRVAGSGQLAGGSVGVGVVGAGSAGVPVGLGSGDGVVGVGSVGVGSVGVGSVGGGVVGSVGVVVGSVGSVGGCVGSVGVGDGWVLGGALGVGGVDSGGCVGSGDHGGLGATGVADLCVAGNQLVAGPLVAGPLVADPGVGEVRRAGLGDWDAGSRAGTPGRSSLGVDPDSVVFVGKLLSGACRLGVVFADSRGLNGTASSRPTTVTTTAVSPASLRTGGPPYRPMGPRTGTPFSSTQKDQPTGGSGQSRSGFQFFGGRQRAFGGSGQPGGGLNCLKTHTFHPQAASQPTDLSPSLKQAPTPVSRMQR
ncbi:hypothetical protein [Kribbella sp. CA-247076]|uniref:hypothetical protein n=1 Tax=Kribbella sp. CA-247076 TaxID=3239941 RepID=UPI003D915E3D